MCYLGAADTSTRSPSIRRDTRVEYDTLTGRHLDRSGPMPVCTRACGGDDGPGDGGAPSVPVMESRA
jgi:hypothetical protein